jgi:hypothetical protein
MRRHHIGSGIVSTMILAAVIASCGGSDSDDGTAQEDDVTDDASEISVAEDASDPETSSSTDGEAGADDGSSEDSTSGDTQNCDAIFSMAEIEEFFAEPVALTEEVDDSIGQLVCAWESIEDPDDMEDLAFKTLFVQVYSGSPIDAEMFIDPSIYDSVTMIEGIGDLAYSTSEVLGTDYFFYDDPVGGSLSYSEVDMGDVDAPKSHTLEDVEELFRTFHDRVT